MKEQEESSAFELGCYRDDFLTEFPGYDFSGLQYTRTKRRAPHENE